MLKEPRCLLTLGNGKVGEAIHLWSLPAILSCVGRSPACVAACYARRGRFRFPAVVERLHANYDACREADFAPRMIAEIKRRGCVVVRVHAAGDFWSRSYIGDWVRIARACPRTRFYAYTRSWREESLRAELVRLARLENVRLWFSTDRDTGPVGALPPGVRVCHLVTRRDEDVPPETDLVFRVRGLRRYPLPLACPSESPAGTARSLTCGACGRCFR